MLKLNVTILFILLNLSSFSQTDPYEIVRKSYLQFAAVKTYIVSTKLLFDIPTVNIKNVAGTSYFKAPDKIRNKMDGIAFVPNENPMKIYGFLKDKSKFTAIYEALEKQAGEECYVLNIIPKGEADFILGKLWISQKNHCIYKIVLTTKRGSVRVENFYGSSSKYSLPDKSVFYLENFKIKKGESLHSKLQGKKEIAKEDKIGTITILYSNYQLNLPISDTIFPQKNIDKVKK